MRREARGPIRVSVGGGKGGVGKSVVAVNLATTLASIGVRTVLVDGDLGQPNLHTMLGVDRVGPTIQALIDRRITSLEEAIVATKVPHLSLLPGTSVPGAANLGHAEKLKLLRHVRAIDAEVVVIDVGAGASFNTLDLHGAADLRFVVTTPELTSLQNAYCFLKASVIREIVALARDHGAQKSWSAAFDGSDTGRMSTWLERMARERPDVARRIRAHVERFGARWIGNHVSSPEGRHAVHALARLSAEFLGVDAPVVATLPPSRAIEQSIRDRTPVALGHAMEPAFARALEQLAEHVVSFTPVPREELAAPDDVEVALETTAEFARRLGPHLRRDERIATRLPAVVRLAGRDHPGTVLDVSRLGLRVRCGASARASDPVELVVRTSDGEVALSGLVRHAGEGAFGVELDANSIGRMAHLASPVADVRASA